MTNPTFADKLCTRCGMAGHRASHCPHPIAHDRCTRCQVGQGRDCACRSHLRMRPLSPTEWIWVLIAADVACLWLLGYVFQLAWRAFP